MTGTSKLRKRATLGFRSHSGWAAAILLSEDLEVLARERIVLCDPRIEGSKQPFHHAEPMPFAKAEAFIARCAASSDALARAALARFDAKIVGACILTASGRPLPDLRGILASHAAIHAAEGEFYRDALARACEAARFKVTRLKERDAPVWAASRLGEGTVKAKLAALGKALGPPWSADEKLATLGAWLTLAA
jgi:hypothetical protein